jgi:hypothetical protein
MYARAFRGHPAAAQAGDRLQRQHTRVSASATAICASCHRCDERIEAKDVDRTALVFHAQNAWWRRHVSAKRVDEVAEPKGVGRIALSVGGKKRKWIQT